MAVPMDYPFLPVIKKFNNDDLTVNGLESMSLIFTSQIKSDSIYSDNLVDFVPLLFTSNRSSTMTGFYNMNPDPKSNPAFANLNQNSMVVGARVVTMNKEAGIQSNIVLVSDSKIFADQGVGSSPENRIFIMNTIDYLLGDSELISLSSREVTDRPLLTEADGVDAKTRLTWKVINMLLPSILIVLLGVYVMKSNKKRSLNLKGLYSE